MQNIHTINEADEFILNDKPVPYIVVVSVQLSVKSNCVYCYDLAVF